MPAAGERLGRVGGRTTGAAQPPWLPRVPTVRRMSRVMKKAITAKIAPVVPMISQNAVPPRPSSSLAVRIDRLRLRLRRSGA